MKWKGKKKGRERNCLKVLQMISHKETVEQERKPPSVVNARGERAASLQPCQIPNRKRVLLKLINWRRLGKKGRLLARPYKLHKWVSNLATWAFFQLCTLSQPQLQAWMSSLTILSFFFFNDQNHKYHVSGAWGLCGI